MQVRVVAGGARSKIQFANSSGPASILTAGRAGEQRRRKEDSDDELDSLADSVDFWTARLDSTHHHPPLLFG